MSPVERVKASELYRLRRLQLAAERKSMEARLAQNQTRALMLALELKYGLLATDAALDVHTGRIFPSVEESQRREVDSEPDRDDSAGALRPPR